MFATTFIDWLVSLVISMTANLVVLGFFKYFNFGIDRKTTGS